MKKSINLISGKKDEYKKYRKIYIGSVVIFMITVGLSMGLLTYSLFLKNAYQALEFQEQEFNKQLLSQVEKRDKILETRLRLSEIKKVLSKRSPVTARINTVSEIVPANTQILGMTGNDTSINLTVESESLLSLSNMLDQKITEVAKEAKKGIKRIEMQSFSLNPSTLKYSVSLSIDFI